MRSSKDFAGSGPGLHHILNCGLIERRWCGLRGGATTSSSITWSVENMRNSCDWSAYLTLAELTLSFIGARGALLIAEGAFLISVSEGLGLGTGALMEDFWSCGCGGLSFSVGETTVFAAFAGGSTVRVVFVVSLSTVEGVADVPGLVASAGAVVFVVLVSSIGGMIRLGAGSLLRVIGTCRGVPGVCVAINGFAVGEPAGFLGGVVDFAVGGGGLGV